MITFALALLFALLASVVMSKRFARYRIGAAIGLAIVGACLFFFGEHASGVAVIGVSLFSIDKLPADDQAAIREFNDRYLAALGAEQPPSWSDLGDFFPTNSPLVTFPIGNLAIKYVETKTGESRTKTLLAKSFDVKTKEFDAGIEADYKDLLSKVFAYRNWQQGPARLMMAEARHRNRSIAALLADGENALWGTGDGIDGENFFSDSHLADFNDPDSDTWSNYQTAAKTLTIANLKEQTTLMQGVLDENGDKYDVDPDTILVPTALYEPTKFLLAQNLILQDSASGPAAAGVTNPYATKFNLVHVPELTNADDWYLVDSKLLARLGTPPWISLRETIADAALELRTWDMSTDYGKDTGKIKVSSHIWYGFSLGFPHGIRKINGA